MCRIERELPDENAGTDVTSDFADGNCLVRPRARVIQLRQLVRVFNPDEEAFLRRIRSEVAVRERARFHDRIDS